MTATHYHSTDTGSPGINLTGSNINRLRQILRACLVDGYQGKAAAGWRIIHEHARGFSLQNGPGTGIINFVQNSAADIANEVIQIYLLESAADTSAALLTGDNPRSGPWYTGSSNASRHTMNIYWPLVANVAAAVWGVVADERTCILTCGSTNGTVTQLSALGMSSLYFGEIKSGIELSGAATFVACGGQISAPSSASVSGGTMSGGYTALRNLGTGLISPAAAVDLACPEFTDGLAVDTASINIADAHLVPSDLRLNPLRVVSGQAGAVGWFRGCVSDDSLRRYGMKTTLRTLGLAQSLESLGKLIDVQGYKLAAFGNGSYQFLATTHPDFW